MKKVLLILICLFVSFEVRSESDDLTGKKILCVREGPEFKEFNFIKGNKVEVRTNDNYKLNLSEKNYGKYSFIGENKEYLHITYNIFPNETFSPYSIHIYLKKLKSKYFDQCFFFNGSLIDFIDENLEVTNRYQRLIGNIEISDKEHSSFYNKGLEYLCQDQIISGLDIELDKTRLVTFENETFRLGTYDDIFEMVKLVNSKVENFEFLYHDLFDTKFYFTQKDFGNKKSKYDTKFICKLRENFQQTNFKISIENLILECRTEINYLENLNLNLFSGNFTRSRTEGNLKGESKDSMFVSKGVCERL